MNSATKTTIVILDHDGTNALIIEKLLKYVGFEGTVMPFNSTNEAKKYLQEHGANIVFIDYYQNENDKFSILQTISPLEPKPDVVVLWDYNEFEVKSLSDLYNIRHYFQKPLLHEEAMLCMESLKL